MDDRDDETKKEITQLGTQMVKPFTRLVRRLEDDRVDPGRIGTILKTFETDVVTNVSPEDVERLCLGGLDLLRANADAIDKMFGDRRERTAGRARIFYDRMRTVDDRFPFAAARAIGDAGLLTPTFFEANMRVMAQIKRASRCRGEPRQLLLKTLAVELVEVLYYSFVHALYLLECLRRGQRMVDDRGGAQLDAVVRWTRQDQADLVNARAAMIRNGAAHPARWTYDVANDRICITDRNPRRAPIELRTGELYRELRAMWMDVNALVAANHALSPPRAFRLFRDCGAYEALLRRDANVRIDEAKCEEILGPTWTEWERLARPVTARRRRR